MTRDGHLGVSLAMSMRECICTMLLYHTFPRSTTSRLPPFNTNEPATGPAEVQDCRTTWQYKSSGRLGLLFITGTQRPLQVEISSILYRTQIVQTLPHHPQESRHPCSLPLHGSVDSESEPDQLLRHLAYWESHCSNILLLH